jgi:hypothetical protein
VSKSSIGFAFEATPFVVVVVHVVVQVHVHFFSHASRRRWKHRRVSLCGDIGNVIDDARENAPCVSHEREKRGRTHPRLDEKDE